MLKIVSSEHTAPSSGPVPIFLDRGSDKASPTAGAVSRRATTESGAGHGGRTVVVVCLLLSSARVVVRLRVCVLIGLIILRELCNMRTV